LDDLKTLEKLQGGASSSQVDSLAEQAASDEHQR
jgi:hypothetical protein